MSRVTSPIQLPPRPVYAWDRFWYPLGAEYPDIESGYLPDPTSEYGEYLIPKAVRLEDVESHPCLILLGEPGMGKSAELRRISSLQDITAPEIMLIDLRQFETMADLISNVFNSPRLLRWKAGDDKLLLVLDSLDEALFDIRVLASRLPEVLSELPIDRLKLRIACRTAEWPSTLTAGLEAIFTNTSPAFYEILPLRWSDVETAARAASIDPAAFLAKVDERDIRPLAAKPTTLRFLLDLFEQRGDFPSTQTAIYAEGCLYLCRELDPERQESGRGGKLSAEARLAVAERIAAASVFGNRAAVWIGTVDTGLPATDTTLASLAGGMEVAQGNSFAVTEQVVREAISTALFSSRGPQRMGWAHHTYGEFLAARWATARNIRPAQMRALICHPEDPTRYLIPQLHQTAMRLATMSPDAMNIVLQTEPEVLLTGEVAFKSEAELQTIVQTILARTEAGVVPQPEFGMRLRYDRLRHSRLDEQLRPFILDQRFTQRARELAVEIAEACQVQQVGPQLADLALNAGEPVRLRVEAARAVATIGSNEDKARLRALIEGDMPEDETDDLRGCALRALWPEHLTADELFSVLGPPKRGNYYGSFSGFLVELSGSITLDMLVPGLRWLAGLRNSGNDSRRELGRAIMLAAWEQIVVNEEVRSLLADEIYDRLQRHDELLGAEDRGNKFASAVSSDAARRHALVSALVERAGAPGDLSFKLVWSQPPLLLPEDLRWLASRALEATDATAIICSELVPHFVDVTNAEHLQLLYENRDHPLIGPTARSYLGPVELGSTEAGRLRQIYAIRTARESQPAAEPELHIQDQAETILARSEQDPSSTWVELSEFLLGVGGRLSRGTWADERVRAGWNTLDLASRASAVDLADRFVRTHVSEAATWYSLEGVQTYGASAAFHALSILQLESPERFAALPMEVWQSWAPVILGLGSSSSDAESPSILLLQASFEKAPDETRAAIAALLKKEDRQLQGVQSLPRLKPIWDESISATLMDLVQTAEVSLNTQRSILKDLFIRGYNDAVITGEAWVRAVREGGAPYARGLAAGSAFLEAIPERGWAILWPLIRDVDDFGLELTRMVSYRMVNDRSRFLTRLREDELADFFAWTVEKFPYPDPEYGGMYSPSPEDEVRRWRNLVIGALRDRGTPEAVNALQSLNSRFPELSWLRDIALKAGVKLREASWRPPAPEVVIKMAQDPQVRLVASPAQLMEVILESLDRFQGELQGELRSAPELWNENPFRPKDEAVLMDKIARHLRRDLRDRGIVANREVVIRRGDRLGWPGQRTDIYVDAIQIDPYGNVDRLTIILEGKGSWHPQVLTAIKEQLVPYLEINQECHDGLYVVGWYLCDRWQDEDRKERTRRLGTIDDVRRNLAEQAEQLSRPGLLIRSLVLDTAWY